jgi:hypothetical protein
LWRQRYVDDFDSSGIVLKLDALAILVEDRCRVSRAMALKLAAIMLAADAKGGTP